MAVSLRGVGVYWLVESVLKMAVLLLEMVDTSSGCGLCGVRTNEHVVLCCITCHFDF